MTTNYTLMAVEELLLVQNGQQGEAFLNELKNNTFEQNAVKMQYRLNFICGNINEVHENPDAYKTITSDEFKNDLTALFELFKIGN